MSTQALRIHSSAKSKLQYYEDGINKVLSGMTEFPFYEEYGYGLYWYFYIEKSHWLFGKHWDKITIGSIHFYSTDDYVTVESCFQQYDDFVKKVALKLVEAGFNVSLTLNDFHPEKKEGMIKCRYCGRFTSDVKTCSNCGGVPI